MPVARRIGDHMSTSGAPLPAEEVEPVWLPDAAEAGKSGIAKFAEFAALRTGAEYPDYESLWTWSTQDLSGFWAAVAEFFDLRMTGSRETVLDDAPMPGTRWFPGARLNYAEHALRHGEGDAGAETAVISVGEDGATSSATWRELRERVGAFMSVTVVLYDGSPVHPGPGRLWELAAEHRVSMLGISPGYLLACAKAGRAPAHRHTSIRTISGGSPWVSYRKRRVRSSRTSPRGRRDSSLRPRSTVVTKRRCSSRKTCRTDSGVTPVTPSS